MIVGVTVKMDPCLSSDHSEPQARKKPRLDSAAIGMISRAITTDPSWRRYMLHRGMEQNENPIAWFQFQHSWEYYKALKEDNQRVQEVPQAVLAACPQLDKPKWDYFIDRRKFDAKTWKLFRSYPTG